MLAHPPGTLAVPLIAGQIRRSDLAVNRRWIRLLKVLAVTPGR